MRSRNLSSVQRDNWTNRRRGRDHPTRILAQEPDWDRVTDRRRESQGSETKKTRGSGRTRDFPCSRSSSSGRPSASRRTAWAHPSSGTCASCGRYGCSGSSGESWLSRLGSGRVSPSGWFFFPLFEEKEEREGGKSMYVCFGNERLFKVEDVSNLG